MRCWIGRVDQLMKITRNHSMVMIKASIVVSINISSMFYLCPLWIVLEKHSVMLL